MIKLLQRSAASVDTAPRGFWWSKPAPRAHGRKRSATNSWTRGVAREDIASRPSNRAKQAYILVISYKLLVKSDSSFCASVRNIFELNFISNFTQNILYRWSRNTNGSRVWGNFAYLREVMAYLISSLTLTAFPEFRHEVTHKWEIR